MPCPWRRRDIVRAGCSSIAALLAISSVSAAMLDTRTVVLDGQGKIIPWTGDPNDGYDRVMGLSWDLLLNAIPTEFPSGLPASYTRSEYSPTSLFGTSWPNNPAGKAAMLADSAALYYAYSGDTAVVHYVRGMLDHQLQHGTTPGNYAWANVPYSTAQAGSVTFGNDAMNEGVGVLEPDKVGELGFHGYLTFYKLTGDAAYRDAAIDCADALATHVRDGDATHSPWPFRVVALTGATSAGEEYCAHPVASIRLFDELIRLGLGDTNAYAVARAKAWDWLIAYPVTNNLWANYFEDVPPLPDKRSNLNQYTAGQTARYFLERPDLNTNWTAHAAGLIEFIRTTFGGTDFGEAGVQYGARVISEQVEYQYKMASHTARYGAINAMYAAATGDAAAREEAYRALNWCTYMCRSNGVVIEGPAEYANNPPCWFTDGHGDYVRHFMLALGAFPEWAPAGESHVTGSSSVITSVSYNDAAGEIAYTTFDTASTESLRVAFAPEIVLAGGQILPERTDLEAPGWVYTASNGVLRIRHEAAAQIFISADETCCIPPGAVRLTNAVPYEAVIEAGASTGQVYRFTADPATVRVQFEVLGPTADVDLYVRHGLPVPAPESYEYVSARPGTNEEHVLELDENPGLGGEWFLTVVDVSGAGASYAVKATAWDQTGQPILLWTLPPQGGSMCFSWNSLPGARYVVQRRVADTLSPWEPMGPMINASGSVTTMCIPLDDLPIHLRVTEGLPVR